MFMAWVSTENMKLEKAFLRIGKLYFSQFRCLYYYLIFSIQIVFLVLKFRSVERHAFAEEAVSFSAGKKGLESGIYLPASVIQKRQGEKAFTLNYKTCCASI